jgi:glycosyltransferase involved in cell wall biosynthesis
MRILLIGRYKNQFPNNLLPFIVEQGEAIRKCGVEVDYFAVKGNGLLAYFTARKALIQKIKEFQPDLIHAHYGLSGITAVLQRKVPVVTTFHNGETLSFSANILSSLFSLRTKFMVYVAQHIYDLAYLKRKKNYVILPCGVDLHECVITNKEIAREELGFLPDKKYILFGGAFENLRKNYPLLKEGIELLKRDDIEVLEMKGLSRLQISKILSACDLFALPTKSEGSPQALKEAMACNCPIIATDVADIKHLLGDLDGHYLCSFDPKDVADKVEKALDFGCRTKGRERIIKLRLTNDLVAKKLVEIYEDVLKNN